MNNLQNELIQALANQDKAKAMELIEQGADINAYDGYGYVLEEALEENYENEWDFEKITDDAYYETYQNPELDLKVDTQALGIMKLALELGYDVNSRGGLAGSDLFFTLCQLFRTDKVLQAGKILLDAGARNVYDPEEYEDALEAISWEASFMNMEGNKGWSNTLEALYQMVYKSTTGEEYASVGSYKEAIGRKILNVKVKRDNKPPCYEGKRIKYNADIYLIYKDGCLVISKRKYCWTDRMNFDDKDYIDVSEMFDKIIGLEIQDISIVETFVVSDKRYYRDEVSIVCSEKLGIKGTTNFGEVPEQEVAYFYEFIENER